MSNAEQTEVKERTAEDAKADAEAVKNLHNVLSHIKNLKSTPAERAQRRSKARRRSKERAAAANKKAAVQARLERRKACAGVESPEYSFKSFMFSPPSSAKVGEFNPDLCRDRNW